MSHWTDIKTRVKNIDALRAACAKRGHEFLVNATARGYRQNRLKADYVIVGTGPYDIAVQGQDDGNYQLTCDFWHGHIEKQFGEGLGDLLQDYAVCVAEMEAYAHGYVCQTETAQNGDQIVTMLVPE